MLSLSESGWDHSTGLVSCFLKKQRAGSGWGTEQAHPDGAGMKVGQQRTGDFEHCLEECRGWGCSKGQAGAQQLQVRKLGTLFCAHSENTVMWHFSSRIDQRSRS